VAHLFFFYQDRPDFIPYILPDERSVESSPVLCLFHFLIFVDPPGFEPGPNFVEAALPRFFLVRNLRCARLGQTPVAFLKFAK